MFSRLLSRRAAVLLLAAATALVSFSIPSSDDAPAEKYQSPRVVGRSVAGSRASIARYWTKERMRNAVPLDLIVGSKRHDQAAAPAGPDRSPRQAPGVGPAKNAPS